MSDVTDMMQRIARKTARVAAAYYRLPSHYDDLVSACLTAIWQADAKLPADDGARSRGGLYRTVARREAWRYVRDAWKVRRREVRMTATHDRGAEPAARLHELPRDVRLAVESLSDRRREVVEQMFLRGLLPPEYARLTGEGYHSVRQAAFYALRDLRERLGVTPPTAPPAARSGRR